MKKITTSFILLFFSFFTLKTLATQSPKLRINYYKNSIASVNRKNELLKKYFTQSSTLPNEIDEFLLIRDLLEEENDVTKYFDNNDRKQARDNCRKTLASFKENLPIETTAYDELVKEHKNLLRAYQNNYQQTKHCLKELKKKITTLSPNYPDDLSDELKNKLQEIRYDELKRDKLGPILVEDYQKKKLGPIIGSLSKLSKTSFVESQQPLIDQFDELKTSLFSNPNPNTPKQAVYDQIYIGWLSPKINEVKEYEKQRSELEMEEKEIKEKTKTIQQKLDQVIKNYNTMPLENKADQVSGTIEDLQDFFSSSKDLNDLKNLKTHLYKNKLHPSLVGKYVELDDIINKMIYIWHKNEHKELKKNYKPGGIVYNLGSLDMHHQSLKKSPEKLLEFCNDFSEAFNSQDDDDDEEEISLLNTDDNIEIISPLFKEKQATPSPLLTNIQLPKKTNSLLNRTNSKPKNKPTDSHQDKSGAKVLLIGGVISVIGVAIIGTALYTNTEKHKKTEIQRFL